MRIALAELIADPRSPVAGAVVVATCNRVELYLDVTRFHDGIDAATALLADVSGLPEVASAVKVRVGAPVAAHLFTVASGLDSMVVGEVEIAGQVSAALTAAQAAGTTTPLLHALFQTAARTAKQVTSTTSLGHAGRSIASVALDVAVGESVPSRALIVGTGAYARVAATALRARGVKVLQVFSPSGRTEAFAARHAAEPVTDLVSAVVAADLVVTASGHGAVLTVPVVEAALTGTDRTLRIVDLSLHPDVGPGVAELPRVEVTGLHAVAGQAGPESELAAAQDVVITAVARFEDAQTVRTLDPAVVALRQHIRGTVDHELDRLRSKYSADVVDDVERALHRVTQSLLHTPTLRAKELARTGDAADYLQALHTLFGIEIPSD